MKEVKLSAQNCYQRGSTLTLNGIRQNHQLVANSPTLYVVDQLAIWPGH
jgi:hypothetical protein